ncbi:MAG: FAD-dependent oxidoreductase [Bacillota bacterium]|nr:FAD-dependent oxidoreductase [Bacillota bacterium]
MDNKYDIIIIGAGPAGLTAAIYALRMGKSVAVLESGSEGGQITSSPKVENYPGIPQIGGFELSEQMINQVHSLGGEIIHEGAGKIDIKEKKVISSQNNYYYKALIVATGSRHKKLGVDGEERLTGMGVGYCAICDGNFYADKDVAVVGGGNTALTEALYLSDICDTVYLIHRRNEFRAESKLVQEIETKDNIVLLMNAVVDKINGLDYVESITVKNSETGKTIDINVSGIFISVGRTLNNEIYEGVLIADQGYIVAGEDCKTSVEGIYAAGDCRKKPVYQITTATADGSIAAIMAFEYLNNIKK